jgi:hypothetical protein
MQHKLPDIGDHGDAQIFGCDDTDVHILPGFYLLGYESYVDAQDCDKMVGFQASYIAVLLHLQMPCDISMRHTDCLPTLSAPHNCVCPFYRLWALAPHSAFKFEHICVYLCLSVSICGSLCLSLST